MDIRASNNIVHIWTCSDSCYALMELINYVSSDGDFAGAADMKQQSRANTPLPQVTLTHLHLCGRYLKAEYLRFNVICACKISCRLCKKLSWHCTNVMSCQSLLWLIRHTILTRSLPGQFFAECHPRVGVSFAEVPAVMPVYGWVTCTEWRVYSPVAANV